VLNRRKALLHRNLRYLSNAVARRESADYASPAGNDGLHA